MDHCLSLPGHPTELPRRRLRMSCAAPKPAALLKRPRPTWRLASLQPRDVAASPARWPSRSTPRLTAPRSPTRSTPAMHHAGSPTRDRSGSQSAQPCARGALRLGGEHGSRRQLRDCAAL